MELAVRIALKFLGAVFILSSVGACDRMAARIPGSDGGDECVVSGDEEFTHNGWGFVKATGAQTPRADSGLPASAASVTLNWPAMTYEASCASVTYNVYRASSSGGQDYSAPLASGISATALSYTDATVVGGQTYYYTLRPVLGSSVIAPANAYSDSEIKLIVPVDGMALVHRWTANQEMCKLMGRATDRANNYRCAYTGPGGNGVAAGKVGTHFDLGHSLFYDLHEAACNYSAGPACGNAYGCLGTAAPTGADGNDGDVFYDRSNSGRCYLKIAGTWEVLNSTNVANTAAARAQRLTLAPGHPPVSRLSQEQAQGICEATTAAGFGTKRLPTRQEQMIAAAWAPSWTEAQQIALEEGLDLPNTGACNSASGAGLTFDASVTPVVLDTLPSLSTSAANGMLVRTGSVATRNCQSLYGIRDIIGNLSEWTSDQLTCAADSCTGITSGVDATNTGLATFLFDGLVGPGGSATVTQWALADMSFDSTKFLVPLGLPVVTASAVDGLAIGTGAGEFDPYLFYGDFFGVSVTTAGTHAAWGGGRWDGGGGNGRFNVNYARTPTDTSSASGGFRCVVDAD